MFDGENLLDFRHRIKSWWNYQQKAQGKYYLHSPFVYKFYTEILEPKPDETCLNIDKEKFLLTQDKSPKLYLGDRHWRTKDEMDLKFGKLLYLLLKHSPLKHVLELQTALGIRTAYLASAKPTMELTTLSSGNQSAAQTVHRHLNLKNITYFSEIEISYHSDYIFNSVLPNFPRLDVCVLGTLSDVGYLEKLLPYVHDATIFIYENMYENENNTKDWNAIKAHKKVTLTIDLFKLGLVFFRKENLAKTDFMLRY